MNDNIRVGLIGYGYASKTFHAPLIAGTPGMELAAISSSDAAKVHADWPTVPVVSEPKHLFNNPDIDLIVIPTQTIPTFRWQRPRWKRVNMWWWINPLP
jgi:predicted dehydrogenase